jgi:hypothetical protein
MKSVCLIKKQSMKLYGDLQQLIINLGRKWVYVVKIHDPTALTLAD